MSRPSVKPLVMAKVIGDVVDMFVPANVKMRVRYNSTHIFNGCELNPSALLLQPHVDIAGDSPDLYTLILTDPDAPSPTCPILREYLHWVVTDIPATSSAYTGIELVSYKAPNPMAGVHRFVFVVFKQAARQTVTAPVDRRNFNTRNFARQNALGPPVAVMYFHARPGGVPCRS